MPITVKELDFALSEFMNESFQTGDSPGYAGAAVSALKSFLPRLRLRLYTATQLYSKWVKVYKPFRATPLTKPWRSSGQQRLAVALLVQFLFFLRTSEIYGLRPSDVSCLNSGHAVVALPHTKTSHPRQSSKCLALDPFLCRVLPSFPTRLCRPFGQDSRSLLFS